MGLYSKDKTSSRQKLKRASSLLRVAYFSYYFSIGCIHPFQSLILKTVGLTNTQLGTVGTVGLIGGIISPVIIGFLADKTKKSRFLLTFISTLNFIFHGAPIIIIFLTGGFAKTKNVNIPGDRHSIPLATDKAAKHGMSPSAPFSTIYLLLGLCLVQFFATFCDQGSKALMDGVVHKLLDESKNLGVPIAFARMRMFGSIGSCMATVTSGILLDYIKKMLPFNYPPELSLVVLCLGMGAVYVVLVALFLPDAETETTVDVFSTFKSVLGNTRVLFFYFVAFVCHFGFGITRSYEPLFVRSMGGTVFFCGISMSFLYMVDVMAMYLSPVICRKLGRGEHTLILTFFVNALRGTVFGIADSFYHCFNNSLLLGLSVGLYVPTISVMVKGQAPEHLTSSYISLLTTISKIGAAVSNTVGGIVSDKHGYRATMFVGAGVFTFNTLVLATYAYYMKLRLGGEGRESEEGVYDDDIEKIPINIEEDTQKVRV